MLKMLTLKQRQGGVKKRTPSCRMSLNTGRMGEGWRPRQGPEHKGTLCYREQDRQPVRFFFFFFCSCLYKYKELERIDSPKM